MDHNALGAQLADGLVVDALALSRCWEHPDYQSSRADGILDQEIDKFSLLFFQALKSADIRKVPMTVVPGRRGAGAALHSGKGAPLYVCDVIELFQSAMPTDRHLFSISKPRGVSQYLQPLLSSVDWERWRQRNRSGQPSDEPAFIEDFTGVVREFTEEQIIALGRHPGHDETLRALRFLIRAFGEEFSAFLTALEVSDEVWRENLVEAYKIARVALQKTTSDRDHYTTARASILRSANTKAREVLLRIRISDDDIWEPDGIRCELAPASAVICCFCRVVYSAIASWANRQERPLPKVSQLDPQDELQAAIASWEAMGAEGISVPIDELRNGLFANVTSVLRECLSKLVQRVAKYGAHL